jgi:hypothetical protein
MIEAANRYERTRRGAAVRRDQSIRRVDFPVS